jgi:hypothetical protein
MQGADVTAKRAASSIWADYKGGIKSLRSSMALLCRLF